MDKSTTHRIQIYEPDEEQVKLALDGRQVAPGLRDFLKKLLSAKKWTRKINIPSGHEDLAAVLIFSTSLRESGLEILSELHVFYSGNVIVEKWEVAGENKRISSLPKEAFRAIDVQKVRREGDQVSVEFTVPVTGGQTSTLVHTFDFSEEPRERHVPHPLESDASPAED